MTSMKCHLCDKRVPALTVRESWVQSGGFGSIPDEAVVCPSCNSKEQRRLSAGTVKLSDLWVKTVLEAKQAGEA